MIDPREKDPQFPDRPDHPDFFDLSEIAQQIDSESDYRSPGDIVGIDETSLVYFMEQRLKGFVMSGGPPRQGQLIPYLMAVWADGVATGRRFEARKGQERPEK